MLTITLSLIQGRTSQGLDLASILVIALVFGGVALVFWASRPSVIARYSADRRDDSPDPPEEDAALPRRDPPEEKSL